MKIIPFVNPDIEIDNSFEARVRQIVREDKKKSPGPGDSGDHLSHNWRAQDLLEKNAGNNIVTQDSSNLSKNEYLNKKTEGSATELLSKGTSDRLSPKMKKPESVNSGFNDHLTKSAVTSKNDLRTKEMSQILPEVPYFDNNYGTAMSNSGYFRANGYSNSKSISTNEPESSLLSKDGCDRFCPEIKKPELGDSGFNDYKLVRSMASSATNNERNAPFILAEAPYFDNNYGTAMSNTRFIKFIPSSSSDWLQENHPNAFLLLCLIAKRARRFNGHIDGLEIGMAHIGDYQAAGIETEKKYRTAKEVLIRLGMIRVIETRRNLRGRLVIGEKNENDEKRATRRATSGTLVIILKSDIWDINPEVEGDFEGEQRATKGRLNGDEQEGKKDRRIEEDHPPYPHRKKDRSNGDDQQMMIDDFSSKKEELIHVHLNCSLSQADLDECLMKRGPMPILHTIIHEISSWPGRKYEIMNWKSAILNWKGKNRTAVRSINNEDKAAKIVAAYGTGSGWTVRVYRDSKKDQRGLLFECQNAAAFIPIFVSFVDPDFDAKVEKILIEKHMKRG